MKLAGRLESGLKAWTVTLEAKSRDQDDDLDILMDTDMPAQVVNKPGGDPKFKVSTRVTLGLLRKHIFRLVFIIIIIIFLL